MTRNKTHIVLNPTSAAGKTGLKSNEILASIEYYLGTEYSLHVTREQLDATDSTRRAVREGCELVVAVGGDGTIQEVVNGFFANGRLINPECHLGIVSSGTGHGFAQSIGLPDELKKQIEIIGKSEVRLVDVGRVAFKNQAGLTSSRYFINECQLGIGAEVVRRVQVNHKQLGGTLAFGIGTLEMAFRHRGQVMTVRINGMQEISERLLGIMIGNGEYTGGGMNLAPGASPEDGLLNVLLIKDFSISGRLRNFPKIYSGSHVGAPGFTYCNATSLSVSSCESVLIEADGELLGTTPCDIEIVPSVLKIRSQ